MPIGYRESSSRSLTAGTALNVSDGTADVTYEGDITTRVSGQASDFAELVTASDPAATLINGALGEMARFYNLPNTQAGCLTDAKQPGAQAIMEKALSTLPLVLSGVDVINGTGELDTSQLLVLEQIVVDDEIACLCKRLKDGGDISDTKNYFEDIREVKPGGHFLNQASTIEACRSSEFIMPQLCDRNSFEQWVELGRPDLYDKAREKVEEILATPQKNPLPDDVIGKLEDIMRRSDEELKEYKKEMNHAR